MSVPKYTPPSLESIVTLFEDFYKGQGPNFSSYRNTWGVQNGDLPIALDCIKCGARMHQVSEFIEGGGAIGQNTYFCELHMRDYHIICNYASKEAETYDQKAQIYRAGRIQIHKVQSILMGVFESMEPKNASHYKWAFLGELEINVPFESFKGSID